VQPRYGGLTAEGVEQCRGHAGDALGGDPASSGRSAGRRPILPKPSTIDSCQQAQAIAAGTWAIVDVDVSELGDRPQSQYYLPQRILRSVDAHARKQGETPVGVLPEQGGRDAKPGSERNRSLVANRPISDGRATNCPPQSRRRCLRLIMGRERPGHSKLQ